MRFLRGKTGRAPTEAEQEQAVEVAAGSENGTAGTGADSTAGTGDAAARRPHSPGKGRPTPSRREAEKRKRGPAPPPPRTQREAIKRMRGNKSERREAAAVRRERMMAGDDKYLLPRDRGPVRAYVRDVVDSRRNVAGLFMPLALLVVLVILIPSPAVQQYVSLLSMAMLLTMIIEGVLLGRIVTRRVRERFPQESASGLSLGFYALTRATQLRRLRMPKPRVARGEAIP